MKVYKLDKSLDGLNNDLNSGIKIYKKIMFSNEFKSIKLITLFV